ncbi:MAG TPA: RNA polymerase sigma factor [Bacteroidales bacterium]|nr:RNA polymerase sigma factor [Bacteroidales bacterium]HPS49918.1 RNA polymerase sigma factor [Bacteroidales bacterium]
MEADLINKVIAREPDAVEALYDHYAPALLSVGLRYCGDLADAEDILHDSFLKIISNLGNFRQRKNGSLAAWMKRIMVNTALNFLRDRKKTNHFSDLETFEAVIGEEVPDSYDTDDQYRNLTQDQIMKIICELPLGYRTVFNLYVMEEFSHKEIAGMLQCSENTSKSQLSKARAMLRKKIRNMSATEKHNVYEYSGTSDR